MIQFELNHSSFETSFHKIYFKNRAYNLTKIHIDLNKYIVDTIRFALITNIVFKNEVTKDVNINIQAYFLK